jgi:hypothetical protein
MIEVLTACILITFTLMILYVIGRLFKKKPKRRDEIKLEKIQVMHLGPFSGQSNSKKGKTVTFMMLLSSLSYADVSITTLSDWNINAFDEETLLVAKTAHSNSSGVKSLIGFQVSRPHCFASRPVISARGSMSSHSDGDIIFAEMKVDKGKFEVLKLKRTYGFNEDGEEVNWFKMLAFPSFAEAKSIEVKFKPQSRIKNFRIDAAGIELAAYQAEQICQSPGPIQQTSYEKKI